MIELRYHLFVRQSYISCGRNIILTINQSDLPLDHFPHIDHENIHSHSSTSYRQMFLDSPLFDRMIRSHHHTDVLILRHQIHHLPHQYI